MNNQVLFCGLGQYSKRVQTIFQKRSTLPNLTGGWYDNEEKRLIVESAAIIKASRFNRLLCKLLLRKEKCFLLSNGYRFEKSTCTKHLDGFTKFAENNTFIIPNTLNFVTIKEL